MAAIGLAALSTITHVPDKLREADRRYGDGLYATGRVLASREKSKRESVLLDATLLGSFEVVAGREDSSLTS